MIIILTVVNCSIENSKWFQISNLIVTYIIHMSYQLKYLYDNDMHMIQFSQVSTKRSLKAVAKNNLIIL